MDIEVNKLGLYESNKNNILKCCIGLLTHEQIQELFELFNGGTYDDESFEEWINGYVD